MELDLKERIYTFVKEADRPMLSEDIAEGMGLEGEELVAFPAALEALETEARLIKNRSDLYGTPERMHLVVGRLSMTAKGFGFIIPDIKETDEDTDVFVPGVHLATAMHGDRVIARVTPPEEEGRSREGEIIRVIERANERIVGTFDSRKTFGFVSPDNTKLNSDIFVPKKAFHGAKTGSKVVVEITKWPEARHNAEGKVVEVLGQKGDPGVDVLAVMRQYELAEDFPEEVQDIADHIEQNPSPDEYEGRRDRRDLTIVTVDGDDSKDFDDGVYVKKNDDGSYFLGVYIADVSWYVREGEPLDKEAYERGTSVYLVDRVVPMLPFALSNGICSLNAGVDRLSMACEMHVSPEGEIQSYEIVPAVIHVYRRLTYNIVNRVLVDKDPEEIERQKDLLPMLETLEELRHIMKAKRHARGSIDFEIPEVKVKLDEQGHPIELIKRTGSLAESIIEECMLAANETVAKHMDLKHLPFLYRVHEQPSDEKIEAFNNLLGAFGLFVHQDEEGNVRPIDVQNVLEKVKGRPEEKIVETVSLRSMQQARYAAESLGHFGLAARYYTHFTSPIRRYPDLVVHRLLRETFATGTIPQERQEKLRQVLPDIAEHASQRERIAIESERETTDMKKIEYMAQFVGQTFSGTISGVTAFGLFVELENGVEGLVHVSTMTDDFYEYKEEQYAMVGEKTLKTYRLGDAVEIVIVRANVDERNLDFVLKENADDPVALENAKGGKKNGKKPEGDKKSGRGRKDGGRPRGGRRGGHGGSAFADAFRAAEHRKDDHPGRNRGKSGERRPGRTTQPRDTRRPSGRKDAKEARLEKRVANAWGTPKEKREKPRDDYQRVRVTGLNKAVWPDPPGYHERKQREEEFQQKQKSADRQRPRPHRKTEDGTKDSK